MKKPKKRLGARGAEEVKGHAFFEIVSWDKLYAKNLESYPLRRKPEVVERERKKLEEGLDLKKQNSLELSELSRSEKKIIEDNEEVFQVIEIIEDLNYLR